jgi:hypothetical protein
MKHVVFSFIFPTWAAMQVTVRFENLGKVFFEKKGENAGKDVQRGV